jgi:hypothetical protein
MEVNSECILGMMSEMNKKLDVVQANCKMMKDLEIVLYFSKK